MTPALYEALLKRYPREEYVVLREVSNSLRTRRVDAIAISLWESRGLEMHGFEVKDSRHDWLRELKDPEKAESLFTACDRWWIVEERDGIVGQGELPPPWGHLRLTPRGLRTVVKAPKLEPRPRSWPFICYLLRKCQEEVRLVERDQNAKVRAQVEAKVRAEIGDELQVDLRRAQGEAKEAREQLRKAEEAVGLSFYDWHLPRLRAAVALERQGLDEQLAALRQVRDRLSEIVDAPAPAKKESAA